MIFIRLNCIETLLEFSYFKFQRVYRASQFQQHDDFKKGSCEKMKKSQQRNFFKKQHLIECKFFVSIVEILIETSWSWTICLAERCALFIRQIASIIYQLTERYDVSLGLKCAELKIIYIFPSSSQQFFFSFL
jgi:hypothetical protein